MASRRERVQNAPTRDLGIVGKRMRQVRRVWRQDGPAKVGARALAPIARRLNDR